MVLRYDRTLKKGGQHARVFHFEAHGLHPYFDLEIVSLLGSEK